MDVDSFIQNQKVRKDNYITIADFQRFTLKENVINFLGIRVS